MRHGFKKRTLNKKIAHRRAMFANMAASLAKHEQIKTTLPKAKELSPVFEKLITRAKKADLAARRTLISFVRDEAMVEKMITVLGPRYKDRHGGYVRVLKAGFRFGDCAPMAIIELVDRDVTAKGQDSGQIVEVEAGADVKETKSKAPKTPKMAAPKKEKSIKIKSEVTSAPKMVKKTNKGA